MASAYLLLSRIFPVLKMSLGNTHVRYDAIPYGEVAVLRDTDAIPSGAVQLHDDAYQLLQEADDDSVVAAAPTGMAVAYLLGSMPLTVIRLETLPTDRVATSGTDEIDLAEYQYLAFGQLPTRQNRPLSEFA